MTREPLVSILIPAYRERFFAEAFASARAQAYPALEILVLDDSAGEAIERCVRAAGDTRVRYVRNPTRLGFGANFTACFAQSRGELIKFLNDDDRLHPQCVAVFASILRDNRNVTLATSRRYAVDEHGTRLPDRTATLPLAQVSAFVPGRELGDFVLMNMVNVIGEPTSAMFRRADLELDGAAGLFRWGGEDYHCLADLSLWLRLLAKGAAFYCAGALSEFRQHPQQEQQHVRLDCLLERSRIARQARAAGFLAGPGQYIAALRAAHAFASHTDFARVSADVAEEVRAELRSIDAETTREGGEPLAAPL